MTSSRFGFTVELAGPEGGADALLARFDPPLSPEDAQHITHALRVVLEQLGGRRSDATPAGAGFQGAVEHAAGVFGQLVRRVERLEAEVAELRGRGRRLPAPSRGGT